MKTIKADSNHLLAEDGMQGARRATGIPSSASGSKRILPPNPEVREKKARRYFSAAYKLRILEEYDSCKANGEIGALLRREGLYYSNISNWRKQREQGVLQGLSPRKRGRKPKEVDSELERLRRENRQLSQKLKQAQSIIEVQKKISEILLIPDSEEQS